MKKVLRFGLFVVLLVTTAVVSSCSKDNTNDNDDPTPPPAETIDEKLNHWMFDYMKTDYLWNDAVKTLKPDFTVNYKVFLKNVLEAVAAQGDVNHEDGHWVGDYRELFYSNIQHYKLTKSRAATRGTRKTVEGTGIVFMTIYQIGDNPVFRFELLAVAPGSPADKAGLKRGSNITRINGEQITPENHMDLVTELTPKEAGKTIRITTAVDESGQLVDQPEITLVSASYDDNPVWEAKILTADNGDKVGYLCYESFNYYYDQQLMDAFREFKSAGVKELILDLRYNEGGFLASSVVMGTMIAGKAKKGLIYAKTTFNKSRTDAGEAGAQYRIGDREYLDYRLLTDAMGSDYTLDLKQVYVLCTNRTASASELVINGLRGLDIEVHLIGETTNGKNVGAKPIINSTMDNGYEYEFFPITFYVENAKGFKDYSSGFPPDVVVYENLYRSTPWGDAEDPLLCTAMKWINDGVKPSGAPEVLSTARAAGFEKRKVIDQIKCAGRLKGMILLPPEDNVQ